MSKNPAKFVCVIADMTFCTSPRLVSCPGMEASSVTWVSVRTSTASTCKEVKAEVRSSGLKLHQPKGEISPFSWTEVKDDISSSAYIQKALKTKAYFSQTLFTNLKSVLNSRLD